MDRSARKRGKVLLFLTGLIAFFGVGTYALFSQGYRICLPCACCPFSSNESPGVAVTSAAASLGSGDQVALPQSQTNVTVAKPQADDQGPPIRLTKSTELIHGFPASVTVYDGERDYTAYFTGRYFRTKMFGAYEVYVVAAYLEKPRPGTRDELLEDFMVEGQAKVYLLRFSKNLSGATIMDAIEEEIESSFTDVDMVRLAKNIDRFTSVFKNGSKAKEEVYIAWLPGYRSYSSYNNPDSIGEISTDPSLARAIFRIWAGWPGGKERFGMVERYAR